MIILSEFLLLLSITTDRIVDLRDRYSVIDMPADAKSYWTTIIQLLLVLPFIGYINLPNKWFILLPVLPIAVFNNYGRTLWYKSIYICSLTQVMPFTRLSGFFVLLCGFLFFNEVAGPVKVIGALIIVFTAVVSVIKQPRNLTDGNFIKAAFYVSVFALSSALTTVLLKYLFINGVSVLNAYFYLRLSQFIALAFAKNSLKISIALFDGFNSFLLNRLLQTAASFLYLYSLSKLPLIYTVPITALVPFIAVGMEQFYERFILKTKAELSIGRRQILQYSSLAIGILLFALG